MINYKEWKKTRWQHIKNDVVKSKRHQLYDYVKKQQEIRNRDKDDFCVSYFLIKGVKITLDDLFDRYNPFMFGFDLNAEKYPKEINCYTDYFDMFNPVYCELDEYGERLRIWKKR